MPEIIHCMPDSAEQLGNFAELKKKGQQNVVSDPHSPPVHTYLRLAERLAKQTTTMAEWNAAATVKKTAMGTLGG